MRENSRSTGLAIFAGVLRLEVDGPAQGRLGDARLELLAGLGRASQHGPSQMGSPITLSRPALIDSRATRFTSRTTPCGSSSS